MRQCSADLATFLNDSYQFYIADLYTITLASGDVYHWTSGDGDITWIPPATSGSYTALLHFDSFPFVESMANPNITIDYTSQTISSADPVFGVSSLTSGGVSGYVDFSGPDAANLESVDYTARFRWTPSVSSLASFVNIINVGVSVSLYPAVGLLVEFSDAHSETVAYTFTTDIAVAFSIEHFNNHTYIYLNGTRVLDVDNALHPIGATFRLNHLLNDIALPYPRVDEFMFLRGSALASGAASYTVETAPFVGTLDSGEAVTWTVEPIRIERDDITQQTGVEVDETTVRLYCNRNAVFGALSVPQFALIGGLDNATISIDAAIMPSYGDVSRGVINLFYGFVTDTVIDESLVELTVSSETIKLDTQVPTTVYQPTCTHTLYDDGCALNKAAFTEGCLVSAGSDAATIVFNTSNGTNFFTLGRLQFTSGLNNGLSRTVRSYTNSAGVGTAVLASPFPFSPTVGDSFAVSAGCDKLRGTCTAKFSNAAQFLAWEYMPVPEASI